MGGRVVAGRLLTGLSVAQLISLYYNLCQYNTTHTTLDNTWTMELSNQKVVFLSRCLLITFISTVTLWYFISPYLVRTHPKFAADMWGWRVGLMGLQLMCFRQQLVAEQSKAPGVEEWVENWTKWQLFLGEGEDRVTIFPQTQASLAHMVNIFVNYFLYCFFFWPRVSV